MGDRLLWVPRVLLFPAHVVMEYGLRWPLGTLTMAAERGRWIQIITELFTFGPGGKMGAFPTALIDFGFRSSVGAYYFWDDAGGKGNALRLHAAIGGFDWLRLTGSYRIQIDPTTNLRLRAEGWRRPDGAFYGIGPSSQERMLSRYSSNIFAASAILEARPSRALTLTTISTLRHIRFPAEECCDEPTLHDRVDAGQLPSPPGYDTGFTSVRHGLRVALDSRAPRPEPASGARLELLADLGLDADRAESTRWVTYGGTAGGFLDITGKNRVLSLSVTTIFADRLGEGEIPFLELPTLGGDGPMRGFLPGRLYGESLAAAKLEYRYPVWAFLDGTLQVAVGNVFGQHLAGFRTELLRTSFAFGVRTFGERDQSFDILVGAGTETFEDGAKLNSARIVFGTTNGF